MFRIACGGTRWHTSACSGPRNRREKWRRYSSKSGWLGYVIVILIIYGVRKMLKIWEHRPMSALGDRWVKLYSRNFLPWSAFVVSHPPPQCGHHKCLVLNNTDVTLSLPLLISSRHPSMDGVIPVTHFERRGSVRSLRTGPVEDPAEMRICIEKLKMTSSGHGADNDEAAVVNADKNVRQKVSERHLTVPDRPINWGNTYVAQSVTRRP